MSTKGIVSKIVDMPPRRFGPIRDALREMRDRSLQAESLGTDEALGAEYHRGRADAYEAAAELLETSIRAANGDLLVGPDEDA
jgi:hypothetical protein